ncbi:MAG: cell division ATP-binding protein FtsE [Erysipelotrichaceae bacterium]|nr:cell division ATP-binding protein FtsE [Erysipelotrichaceae bacterium]
MIKIENVFKIYKNGTRALNNVNLNIEAGEFVYIMGSTGSGKSTLIKLLDGEEIPSGGLVEVGGVNVGKLKHRKVPLYRRNIGVVFQDYRLLPKKTVFENIAFAMQVCDAKDADIRKRVRKVMKLVELKEKSTCFPNELSGGQQQRVAIARAIANRPKILIADEPTGNLDPKMSDDIIKLFERINKEENTTILIVTHDSVIVKEHPKRTIVLDSGHIVGDMNGGVPNV